MFFFLLTVQFAAAAEPLGQALVEGGVVRRGRGVAGAPPAQGAAPPTGGGAGNLLDQLPGLCNVRLCCGSSLGSVLTCTYKDPQQFAGTKFSVLEPTLCIVQVSLIIRKCNIREYNIVNSEVL